MPVRSRSPAPPKNPLRSKGFRALAAVSWSSSVHHGSLAGPYVPHRQGRTSPAIWRDIAAGCNPCRCARIRRTVRRTTTPTARDVADSPHGGHYVMPDEADRSMLGFASGGSVTLARVRSGLPRRAAACDHLDALPRAITSTRCPDLFRRRCASAFLRGSPGYWWRRRPEEV